MSFVTFVRDYIQDPDKIVHIPSFILDACREFLWYIFSFQWLRNLTYVTLSLAYPEGLSSDSGTPYLLENLAKTFGAEGSQNNGVVQQNPSISLSTMAGDFLASSGLPISIPNGYPLSLAGDNGGTLTKSNIIAPFLLRTQEGFSFLHTLQEKYMSGEAGQAKDAFVHELSHSQFSATALLTNSAYGLFNGITSNFHFCAITIIIVHIILNENKNRAFKIATISCTADLSCMVAVLLGFRGLIIPWFAAEPLGYFLGFAIQFYFALEIIKDNRRIKSFEPKGPKDTKKAQKVQDRVSRKTLGQLSYNYWLIPTIVLFSWCEQTQFFQTLASNGFQPTATLMGLPFVASGTVGSNGISSFSAWQGGDNLSTALTSNSIGMALSPLLPYTQSIEGLRRESSNTLGWSALSFFGNQRGLQILVYLLSYIITRIAFTWIGLSIFQKVIDWKNNNYFRPFPDPELTAKLSFKEGSVSQKVSYVKDWIYKLINALGKVPKGPGSPSVFSTPSEYDKGKKHKYDGQSSGTYALQSGTVSRRFNAPPLKIQSLLRDPLAIAAVACSFAFLPSYSTNLLLTKSVGFFPEESRVENSFFSPWDMPAEVLASDMDFISSHHNLAEYPFFLPFYDKGEYGGWLGVGEEDVRYGPFRLWQTRRIRAPWRRTTLQEPALTYANDKSLFVNPNPNPRKEESTSITFGQPLASSSLPLALQDTSLSSWKAKNFIGLPDGIQKNFTKNIQPYKSPETEASYETSPTFPLQISSIAQDNLRGTSLEVTGRDPSESKDLSSAFLWRIPVGESSLSNSTITKNGRKRLIEGFKKPVRKMSTSKLFNQSTFSLPVVSASAQLWDKPYGNNDPREPKAYVAYTEQQKGFLPLVTHLLPSAKHRIGGFINTLSEKITSTFNNQYYGKAKVLQIKNTKQIRKRFKKFKKRVRLFRNKSYKKRNTKIRRLKHFHYLRNKKKKRRNSRRLIYKLRRQFPYIRNIKERKAEIFGLYSPVSLGGTDGKANIRSSSTSLPSKLEAQVGEAGEAGEAQLKKGGLLGSTSKVYAENQENLHDSTRVGLGSEDFYAFSKMHGISGGKWQSKNNEKYSYDRGYPKNKSSRNYKKDFNLIFRTQMGERLDFAQEEIRARIFMNPYIRFLLNRRIDNFLSREKKDFESKEIYSRNPTVDSKKKKLAQNQRLRPSVPNPDLIEAQNPLYQSAKLTADTEEKLFKRRLIISKYADAIDFLKPNSRHSYVDRIYNHQFKGTLSTARRLFSLKVQYDQPLVHSKNYEPVLEHEDFLNPTDSTFGNSNKTKNASTPTPKPVLSASIPSKEYDQGGFLEKSSTAPFYAAWDEASRKLVFTNRYLDHKLATRGQTAVKNHHQQFTSWPLKEPYFKDNEFLVSQLYSNSQPIDSFLSQENEKARPVTLPRRVSSFNTVLSYKNSVPPTDAQRSQQLFKIENNDRKTFLFKHLWTTSNTAEPKEPKSFRNESSMGDGKTESKAGKNKNTSWKHTETPVQGLASLTTLTPRGIKYKLPTSAEQKKTTRMEEREYPLWMVLRTLAPNQGGFLWPGD